jgi:hypothetical protein
MMTLENAAHTIEAMFGWSSDSARAFAKSLFATGIAEEDDFIRILGFLADKFIDEHGVDPRRPMS